MPSRLGRSSILLLLLVAMFIGSPVHLCAGPGADSSIYRTHRWVDGPIVMGSAVAAIGGAVVMAHQAPLGLDLLRSLDRSSVSAFDRSAFHIDLGEHLDARQRSDIVLGTSVMAPFLLLLDKRARRQWAPLLLLYTEAMTMNSAIQTWTAVTVGRYRPIAYLPEASLAQRMDRANHNSFFSGHTSSTATATFFMARVLDDLHPELGAGRWLLYAAAAVPPALAGWYRIRAGKHFPSDVITGYVFGAAVGVLLPALHRNTRGCDLGLMPVPLPGGAGLAMELTW